MWTTCFAMIVRQAKTEDAEQIAELYNWYILNTVITFETEVIPTQEMGERIQEKISGYDWLVGEVDEKIVGYAYYGSFRSRPAYNHTIESSIYLSQNSVGKGYGRILYSKLIESAKEKGFKEMIGVIALPNEGSLALHQKLGFEEAGVMKRIGYKFGQYIDVAFWQRAM